MDDVGFESPGVSVRKSYEPFKTRNTLPCLDVATKKANQSLTLIPESLWTHLPT